MLVMLPESLKMSCTELPGVTSPCAGCVEWGWKFDQEITTKQTQVDTYLNTRTCVCVCVCVCVHVCVCILHGYGTVEPGLSGPKWLMTMTWLGKWILIHIRII